MANTIGWGSGAANNSIGWGQGKTNNTIDWGEIYDLSPSGETDLVGVIPPTSLTSPVVSGSGVVGQTLSTTDGTWSGTLPITFTYQWNRNGSVILGATNNTYTLVTADASTSIDCTVTATNAGGSLSKNSNAISVAAAGDADANAFIAAAAITDTTQKSAIDKLVVDLKGYGIWSKMKAIYPFCGGTASQHKYNLRNPVDSDAAFRLVFNGGWTHSSGGALPNGTNAWANTFLNPSTKLTINNTHLSYYSRTQDISKNGVDMGSDSLSANFALTSYYAALSTGLSVQYIYPEHTAIGYASSTRGFFIGSRINITTNKLYRNATILGTDSTTQARLLPTSNLGIGANNISGTPTEYQNHECAFSSIGDGLTDTEAANYYTAVQTFQTTLGRQVV